MPCLRVFVNWHIIADENHVAGNEIGLLPAAVAKASAGERLLLVTATENLARMLEHEGLSYVALDLDPDRVAAAAAAGESVVYGDAGRRGHKT